MRVVSGADYACWIAFGADDSGATVRHRRTVSLPFYLYCTARITFAIYFNRIDMQFMSHAAYAVISVDSVYQSGTPSK